jgi:hypothetical protein
MTACIIFHNMIIEEERDLANDTNFHRPRDNADPSTGSDRVKSSFVQRLHQLENKKKHQQLQNDLIEHHWAIYGNA